MQQHAVALCAHALGCPSARNLYDVLHTRGIVLDAGASKAELC